jgi:alpha-beta hydrolase superfamily lysophospholipase
MAGCGAPDRSLSNFPRDGRHALRYAHVAKVLADAGFHVYANDHRGHGRTANDRESLGDFGAGGWNALVADIVELTRTARAREAGLPVILLGHSMGSFAVQQYLLDHSDLVAASVLSGSASIDKLPIHSSLSIFVHSIGNLNRRALQMIG